MYHVLYGRGWRAVLLEIKEEVAGVSSPREVALVRMQPNTEHEFFFRRNVSTKYRINDSMGYISINWLFPLEEKKK